GCGLEIGDALERSRLGKRPICAALLRGTSSTRRQKMSEGRGRKGGRSRRRLSTINRDAAGIDIGATVHVVAVAEDRCDSAVRSFRTFTSDLRELADWLAEVGIKTVAMESTGVYWIPVYELLEER